MTLEDSAFAKLNLGLRILGRRPDGFHDIRSVFHTVSLHDTVRLSAEPGVGRVVLRTSGIEIPCEEAENLASRAARLFLHEIGLSLDAEICIEKRIPVGSGLGGGSSDAACVLRLLRRASGMDPGIDEIAPRLGSDVPFLVRGGAALVEGRGELVTPVTPGDFWAVLINPGLQVSTAAAYEAWDNRHPSLTVRPSGCDDRPPELAWHEGRPFPVSLCNDFLPLLLEKHPVVLETLSRMERSCPAWGLSGKGPTFYGLFRTQVDAEAFGLSVPRNFSAVVCRATGDAGASFNW